MMELLMPRLKKRGSYFLFIVASAIVAIVAFAVMGLVLSSNWNWFVSPITGFRNVSVSEGIGLSIFLATVYAIITLPFKASEVEHEQGDSPNAILFKGFGRMVRSHILWPLAGLAGAWIWHAFIISPPMP